MANKSADQIVDGFSNEQKDLSHSGDFTGGSVRCATGLILLAQNEGAGSIMRFARIPAKARILSIQITSDVIATGVDVGAYKTTEDDGSVINVNVFRDAQSLAANNRQLEVLNLSAENKVKDLAELLGRTTVQRRNELAYDVCLTMAATNTAGRLLVDVYFIL